MIGRSRRIAPSRIASVDGMPLAAQFVDVGDVNDRRLHRDAEQGQEADAGRNRERRAGQPQRHDAAHRRRQHHAQHGDEGEFEIAVEREQQQEDQEQGQRQDDSAGARGGVFGVFAAPVQAVALRQRDLLVDLAIASSTAPARSRPSTENCTPM